MYKNNKNYNKGLALIISLAILSILLALATYFATESLIFRSIADKHNELAKSRILLRSTLNRVISGMKVYAANTDKNFTDVISKNFHSISKEAKSENLEKLLPTKLRGINYYTKEDYNSGSDTPEWKYLPYNRSSDTELFGRIAYVVIGNAGKLNPSYTVDSGYNALKNNKSAITEYGSPAAPPSVINQYPANTVLPSGETKIGRIGISISEIWLYPVLDKLIPKKGQRDQMLKSMSSVEANPAGRMPIGGWETSEQFFDKLNIDESKKNEYESLFSFNSEPTPEAFWVDENYDNIKTENELYHRFNLKRDNWDNLTCDSIVNEDPILHTAPYSEKKVTSLPWVKNWKESYATGPDTARKYQIAANLIDYCDADTQATTDEPDNPNYTGLDKSPYLNEIKINVSGEIIEDKWNFSLFGFSLEGPQYICKVLTQPKIEVANMYDNLDDSIAELNLSYKYKWHFTIYWQFEILGISFSDSMDYITKVEDSINPYDLNINYSGNSYDISTSPVINISPEDNVVNVPSEIENIYGYKSYISDFKITNCTLKLKDENNKFQDYSKVITGELPSNNGLTVLSEDTPTNTEGDLYYHSHVNDPQHNLRNETWSDSSFVKFSDPGDSLGNKNTICNPNSGNVDDEPSANQPEDISTAYIRNAPMKSPWELGAIHRGKPWQTLNLKKYNETEGMTGGGNQYSKGDANILNQIKMSSDIETSGKININTYRDAVLKALFYGIYTNSGYENPGKQEPPNTWVDDTLAKDLKNDVLSAISSGGEFKTRAELLRENDGVRSFSDNSLGLSQTNDATQEEIIGKFINLTKAERVNSGIVIILLAQTINDISEIAGASKGKYDIGIDVVTSTQKAFVIVSRDPVSNKFSISRYEFIE